MGGLKESTTLDWLGTGVAWETYGGGREAEPGQQGSKAEVLLKLLLLEALPRTALLLRSTGSVCWSWYWGLVPTPVQGAGMALGLSSGQLGSGKAREDGAVPAWWW